MVFPGKVVGGHYVNSSVEISQFGKHLVVQIMPPFKSRKINEEEVAEWKEVVPDPRGDSGIVGAVGKAVAGAALPGFVGKMASAAVGAGIDAVNRQRLARIDWVDGKQSLLKLPPNLFTHLEVLLEDRRADPIEAPPAAVAAIVQAPLDPTGHVLTQIAGLIKDRRDDAAEADDLTEQLTKLAALRDRGILTEAEFVSKKTELLSRL